MDLERRENAGVVDAWETIINCTTSKECKLNGDGELIGAACYPVSEGLSICQCHKLFKLVGESCSTMTAGAKLDVFILVCILIILVYRLYKVIDLFLITKHIKLIRRNSSLCSILFSKLGLLSLIVWTVCDISLFAGAHSASLLSLAQLVNGTSFGFCGAALSLVVLNWRRIILSTQKLPPSSIPITSHATKIVFSNIILLGGVTFTFLLLEMLNIAAMFALIHAACTFVFLAFVSQRLTKKLSAIASQHDSGRKRNMAQSIRAFTKKLALLVLSIIICGIGHTISHNLIVLPSDFFAYCATISLAMVKVFLAEICWSVSSWLMHGARDLMHRSKKYKVRPKNTISQTDSLGTK